MESLTLVVSPAPSASGSSVQLDVDNNPFGRGLTTSGTAFLERWNGQEWTKVFQLNSGYGDRPESIQPLGSGSRLRIQAVARALPLDFILPSVEPGRYRLTLPVGIPPSGTGPLRRAELHRILDLA